MLYQQSSDPRAIFSEVVVITLSADDLAKLNKSEKLELVDQAYMKRISVVVE